MKILSTSGTSQVQNTLTYAPQYLFYTAATQLTNLRVTDQQTGVILDLSATYLNSIGRFLNIGARTNGYLIPVSDGKILNRNVTVQATAADATVVDIYAFSLNATGQVYISSQLAEVKVGGATFSKFLRLYLPNSSSSDILNVNYGDGLAEQMDPSVELAAILTLRQNVQNSVSDRIVDNTNQSISKVTFNPAATQTVAIQRIVPVNQLITPIAI